MRVWVQPLGIGDQCHAPTAFVRAQPKGALECSDLTNANPCGIAPVQPEEVWMISDVSIKGAGLSGAIDRNLFLVLTSVTRTLAGGTGFAGPFGIRSGARDAARETDRRAQGHIDRAGKQVGRVDAIAFKAVAEKNRPFGCCGHRRRG